MKKYIQEDNPDEDSDWESILVETSPDSSHLIITAFHAAEEDLILEVNIQSLKEALGSTEILDNNYSEVDCGNNVKVWTGDFGERRRIVIGRGMGTGEDHDCLVFTRLFLLELIQEIEEGPTDGPAITKKKKLTKKQLQEQEKAEKIKQALEKFGDLVE